MVSIQRFAMVSLLALVLCLMWGSRVSADDPNRSHNESVYREYRAAKRQQVSDLCEIWFATWRPGKVGKTYIALAEHYASIDTSSCSPVLRKHIKKAERICTEIAELFGQGTMSDMEIVLRIVKVRFDSSSSPTVKTERGLRILELMRELSASEEVVVKKLGLED